MDFKSFVENVEKNIKDHLPQDYQNAEVDIHQHQKLNESYIGLCVRKSDSVINPTINLDDYFEMYGSEIQKDMNMILDDIAGLIQKEAMEVDIDSILNYEQARESLFIRVSSAEKNADLLNQVPHQLKEDLAITYHIVTDLNMEGIASTIVNNEILRGYGVTPEQLHADAVENSMKMFPVHVESLGEMVKKMMVRDMKEMGLSEQQMEQELEAMGAMENPLTVVTNNVSVNGAAALFYEDQMDKLGELLEGDFFILPSSVHEVIVVPDNGDYDTAALTNMVLEANDTQVREPEQLSDHVYHYDTKARVFERAEKFDARQQKKAHTKEAEMGDKAGTKTQQKAKPKHKSNDMSL